MGKVIIADCGSTTADWAVVTDGTLTGRFRSEGFNASALGEEEILRHITPVADWLAGAEEVRFYGAGCREGEPSQRVEKVLRSIVGQNAVITAGSDLRAAIQAVAPEGEAIVSILGTGANCCRVSGGKVVESVRSAGFILGDEGSGAAMGRQLMGEYIGGRMPRELTEKLEKEYALTPYEVIDRVYRRERPNAFLGSFAPFLADNLSHPWIERLVDGQMRLFVANNISRISGHESLICHFVGSVARYFAPRLRKAMEGVAETGLIIASPLDEIVGRLTQK